MTVAAAEIARPLLRVRNVVQEFPLRGNRGGGVVHAVSDVSFDLDRGETLGVVGETGSGKSTLARALLQAPSPISGSVHFRGEELTRLRGRRLLEQRRQMQMVFQDPFTSLDPKWRVLEIVEEPLIGYGVGRRKERRRRVDEVLELVGLPAAAYGHCRPRELSGGQCQRVAIARALALDPALIICDEAVSSLDVLLQVQVIDLFKRLRNELGLAYLFIAHDLTLVRRISHRIAVMHAGSICEMGAAESVYRRPTHPYTVALITSNPSVDAGRRPIAALSGDPPSPIDRPSGCRFRTRCPRAQERCALEEPSLRSVRDDHFVACHFPVLADEARFAAAHGPVGGRDSI